MLQTDFFCETKSIYLLYIVFTLTKHLKFDYVNSAQLVLLFHLLILLRPSNVSRICKIEEHLGWGIKYQNNRSNVLSLIFREHNSIFLPWLVHKDHTCSLVTLKRFDDK